MSSKERTHRNNKSPSGQQAVRPGAQSNEIQDQPMIPAHAAQKGRMAPRLLTPGDVFQLQRTLGNRAVGNLLSAGTVQAKPTATLSQQNGRVVQRLDIPQAFLTVQSAGIDMGWYHTMFFPALQTIAARAGQSVEQYIGPLSAGAFLTRVRELQQAFRQEPEPGLLALAGRFFGSAPTGPTFINSEVYPGMMRVEGTNILVDPANLPHGHPSAALLQFIQDYQAGTLVWYRGLNIAHFAWGVLQTTGVLASEGTADIPTFTMGNANPSRWLPGVNDHGTAQIIARTVNISDAGLRDLATHMEVPTGAILRYTINPGIPIAYLNVGEQVVRGPIAAGSVVVDAVPLLGPGGFREVAQNIQPTDLPPQAPYQAGVNSVAINNWDPLAQAWVATH